MLYALVTLFAALAADSEVASGTGPSAAEATASETSPTAPASAPATNPPPTSALATPAAPAEPTATAASAPPETTPSTLPPTSITVAPAAPDRPTIAQRRAYMAGRILANAGIVAMPVGVMTAAANLNLFGGGTPSEEFLFAGGALAAISALPLAWTGTALERSAIRRAGCRPGGDGWRYAPLVPLALGAVRALDDSEEIALGVAGAWAVVGAQHIVLQPSAKRCGLRGHP